MTILSYAKDRPKVAIIGGGMSGSAAAIFLAKGNYQIDLYEKATKLGGNAQTLHFKNKFNDQNVSIDMGPDSFTFEGWDNYIGFLKKFSLFENSDVTTFAPSIAVYNNETNQREILMPGSYFYPKLGLLKMRNLKEVRHFIRFLFNARKLYLTTEVEKYKMMTFDEWLDLNNFRGNFRNDIIKPLIASMANATLDQVGGISAMHAAQFFGFRRVGKRHFFISNRGMGEVIELMVQKTQTEFPNKLNIFRGSEIIKVTPHNESQWEVVSVDGSVKIYDHVVFATHPYQASKILTLSQPQQTQVEELKNVLNQFQYRPIFIGIHNNLSETFKAPSIQGFYNILLRNGSYNLTMNYATVHPRYQGVLKSWIENKETIEQLIQNNNLYGFTSFQHPIVTPEFIKLQNKVMELTKSGNLHIIGGWMSLFETQETAITTAFGMIKKLDSNLAQQWIKEIPTLSK